MSLIFIAYVINAIDRGIIGVVIEPLKAEFGLSDSQVGVVSALAFGISYAVAVLPIGWMVDRFSRRNLLAGLLAAWSAMTALGSLASNVWHLIVLRAGVGATEAGSSPASNSLISDIYEPEKRMSAFSLVFAASAIGAALAAAGGAWIAEHYGWRAAFLVAGLPGLAVALLLVLTTREPVRGAMDGRREAVRQPGLPLRDTLRFCMGQPSLLFVYSGAMCGGAVLSITGVWTIPFLTRSHGLSLTEAGIAVAFMLGTAVSLGAIAGGVLVDRVSRNRPRIAVTLIGATTLCGAPMAVLGLLADGTPMALVGLFLAQLFAATYMAVGTGTIVDVTDPRMRGFAIAIRDFLNNLIGYGVAPFAVGVVSTAIGGGQSLRYALLITVVATIVGTSISFLAVSRTLARDRARARAFGDDDVRDRMAADAAKVREGSAAVAALPNGGR